MRKETVETKSKKSALETCPWACICIKVEGGYKCFESYDDYKTWRNQK